MPDFSITTFISGDQKRIGYPRNSHHSVSIRTPTVEELLKSFLFLGEKKAVFPEVSSKNSGYHGSLEKNYPKKVLFKTTAGRGVDLSPGTREFFLPNFSLSLINMKIATLMIYSTGTIL